MKTRERAIAEGRALVEVRSSVTGGLRTVGVCPACWNLRIHRPALLAELAARGLAVVHGGDGGSGRFSIDAPHAPGCPRALRGE